MGLALLGRSRFLTFHNACDLRPLPRRKRLMPSRSMIQCAQHSNYILDVNRTVIAHAID